MEGRHPLSARPGGFGVSPYMQELSCHMGQEAAYGPASEMLGKYLRVEIGAKQIERMCNYYGSRIAGALAEEEVKPAPAGQVYAMADGSMICTREGGWKEVKLGRIFSASSRMQLSGSRNWIRQSEYVAETSSLEAFTDRMDALIPPRCKLAVLADGAAWIWKWASSAHPEAIQILDCFHAFGHAAEFAAQQFPDPLPRARWLDLTRTRLLENELDLVLEDLRSLTPCSEASRQARDSLLNYYWNNYHRMRYKTFRRAGLLIGSGPIESAHRTVIQKRLKLPGQRWIRDNAQKVINLRVANLSGKWDRLTETICNAA